MHVKQPHLIQNYNQFMGGVDLYGAYLSSLFGRKKWYWMALVNYIRVLQLAAFKFYGNYHNRKTAQFDFLWNIVIEISSKINNQTHITGPKRNPCLPQILDESHFSVNADIQGCCTYCKKMRMKYNKCNIFLHESFLCFYHFYENNILFGLFFKLSNKDKIDK